MDLGREFLVALLLLSFCFPGSCNLVFEVQHKFKGRERSLSALKAHDVRRHGSRLLSVIDLQLGGNGHPAETGLAIFSHRKFIISSSDDLVFMTNFSLLDVILKSLLYHISNGS